MMAGVSEPLVESPHPSADVLVAGLNEIAGESGPITVLARRSNPYASRSRSEIVTCRAGNGTELKLFLKYGTRNGADWDPVAYEAEFYKRILRPLNAGSAKFYGQYSEVERSRTWLALEFLDTVTTLDDLSEPASMESAATWLGRFHADCDRELSRLDTGFLRRYGAGYYLEFARSAARAVDEGAAEYTWLRHFERAFEQFIAPLLDIRLTITHGDYYPHNILARQGALYPIDWEYGGLEAGELDLACLFDSWPENVVSGCTLAYARARWSEGPPNDFGQVVDACRVAICCHNVGMHANWIDKEEARGYCRQLRRMAERLELI